VNKENILAIIVINTPIRSFFR